MYNKFFTTIWICSSSLGLVIIWVALALHWVMKAKNDSLGSCLVVSKSLLVTSKMLYLLIMELPTYILPISSSSIFHIKEPFEGGSS